MFCIWNFTSSRIFFSPFFLRWIKMRHVKSCLKFHTCRNPKFYRKWTSLINRVGFTVGSSTRVCSNHFEPGRPSLDKPHPTLYLKGYPGISSLKEETPVKRQRVERSYKSPVKRQKSQTCSGLYECRVTTLFRVASE